MSEKECRPRKVSEVEISEFKNSSLCIHSWRWFRFKCKIAWRYNESLKSLSESNNFTFIDNSIIDNSCLNSNKLHLNSKSSALYLPLSLLISLGQLLAVSHPAKHDRVFAGPIFTTNWARSCWSWETHHDAEAAIVVTNDRSVWFGRRKWCLLSTAVHHVL